MKNLLCTLLCSLVPLFAGNFGRADETSGPGRFRIAGYMPDYRLAAFDPSSFDGLTDLILFSAELSQDCLLYTSPSPRDKRQSRMPSSA